MTRLLTTGRLSAVSFFLDNSIGVLRFLADEGGEAHLVADGRIGKAVPRPEDGRE